MVGYKLNGNRQYAVKIFVILLLLGLVVTQQVAAQPVSDTIMENVEVEAIEGGALIKVEFRCGVRYITHFPEHAGSQLRVRLKPELVCVDGLPSFSRRGTLVAPGGQIVGLSRIVYEDDIGVGQYITLYFDQEVIYEVIPGSDYRGLSIIVHNIE